MMTPDQWHTWWLADDGTWVGQRPVHGATEAHIVPESQRRDHLPSGCVCGTSAVMRDDGVLVVTHNLK